MSHFCLLSEPETYHPHADDLLKDPVERGHWLDHFAGHFQQTLKFAATQYGRTAGRAIQTASQTFTQQIEAIRAKPDCLPGGLLNIMELCRLRERVLRANKLNDPFGYIKDRENAAASKLYPQVVRRLHAMAPQPRWLHLIECIFAGNIFDLGSASTMRLAHEPTDFFAEIEETKPRPWLVDDFDRLAQDLPVAPPTKWAKAIIFVDNAGSDFILGVMPLARELGLFGTKIVLAANELPSLNDMTVNETIAVVEKLAVADSELAVLIEAGMLEVVSSGGDTPLIDLSNVSDELNAAAADADLVVLEGMGRAVETNFHATFKVDSLKLALLKDDIVAKRIGGEIYDCVCKYEPAAVVADSKEPAPS